MKIIVDTNIAFSAVLNTNSKIGDLLLNSDTTLQFYSHSFIKEELTNHHEKLKSISKLNDEEIKGVKELLFKKIKFIREELIPEAIWIEAEQLVANVDIDDTDFVALSIFIEGYK